MNRPNLVAGILLCLSAPALARPAPSQAADVGAPAPGPSYCWADYDGDGLEDLFVADPAGPARLLRNLGDGSFADETTTAGLDGCVGARLATWEDLDRDGCADLLVAGGATGIHLYRNSGRGSFVEIGAESGLPQGTGVLAASWQDYDGDGLPDLQLTTVAGDRLFHNLRRGAFESPALDLPVTIAPEEPARIATVPDEARPQPPAEEPGRVSAPPASGSRRTPVGGSASAGGGRRAAGGNPGVSWTGAGANQQMTSNPVVADALTDQGAPGSTLYASSVPTLGMLYPISSDLYVSPNGNVGIGTANPTARLQVNGWADLVVDDEDSRLRFRDVGNYWYSMGIDQDDGAVGGPKSGLGIADEVRVSGRIQDVDLVGLPLTEQQGCADRYLPVDLGLCVVRPGRSVVDRP